MTTEDHDDGGVDERLQNLGLVVDTSAKLEQTLRNAFCSIIGNKYAVVLADSRSAEWFIRNCRAVLRRHREITGEHRANIRLALDACERANDGRNALVHGHRKPSGATGGQAHATKGSACNPGAASESTAKQVRKVADDLAEADKKLFCALKNAVSPEVMVIGEALGWAERRDGGTAC